jgi:hypothetical protein
LQNPEKISAILGIQGFGHRGFQRERRKEPNPIEPFLEFQDLGVREAKSQEMWSPDS